MSRPVLSFFAVCSAAFLPPQVAGSENPNPDGFGAFHVTVAEESGISRAGEPVQVSLPFAPGALIEPTVAIHDDHGPVEAQFEVLARWGDGSIRWLLSRLLVDVPAQRRIQLTVQPGKEGSIATDDPLATKEGNRVAVDTVAIRAVLGVEGFDSFLVTDSAGKPLLSSRPALLIYALHAGEVRRHRASLPDQVIVEENGPLYASVFVSGPMKADSAESIFRYETRMHFWRGKRYVLAEHTLVSVGGPDVTVVDGVVVELKAKGELERCAFGTKSRHERDRRTGSDPVPGQVENVENLSYEEVPLQEQGRVRLHQSCAHWLETLAGRTTRYLELEADFGFSITRGGRRIAAGQKSPGWLWASGGSNSIGIAVGDFWEEGPKALSVARDGRLGIELYAHWQPKADEPRPERQATPDFGGDPRVDSWAKDREETGVLDTFLKDTGYQGPVRRGPMRFGRTRAKTTAVWYLFGSPEEMEQEMTVLAARRSDLIPVVDPAYLCRTHAMHMVYVPAAESGLPKFERGLLAAFDGFKNETTPYGFLRFGCWQCTWGYNRTIPSTSDCQEYDTLRCLLTQYARTGRTDYFRWARYAARHLADVDQNQLDGTIRFHGYRGGGDYHEEPKSPDMGGHIYIQGMVDHYMLTGDRRSLRCAQRVGDYLMRHFAQGDTRERVLSIDERSLTRPGIALLAIYDLTREQKYLKPVDRMVAGFNACAGDLLKEMEGQDPFRTWWLYRGDFVNHVQELLLWHHMVTGDPATLRTLHKTVEITLRDHWDPEREGLRGPDNMYFDRPWAKFPDSASSWLTENLVAFAYLTRATGDEKYVAPFLDLVETWGDGWEQYIGNRAFTRHQLWSVPAVSMLPEGWRDRRDQLIMREAFHARLTMQSGLSAWTVGGKIKAKQHGEIRWADSPFGLVLRTLGRNWISFDAPEDILLYPGTLSFWVQKQEATWGRKPWPSAWFDHPPRSLVHIASDRTLTNALDLMISANRFWTRVYDPRGWEQIALPADVGWWNDGRWHHVVVVWNRHSLTAYIDGRQVSRDETFALPAGGQQKIQLGWRPGNWYGQAAFYNLRLFRSAFPPRRVKRLYEQEREPISG